MDRSSGIGGSDIAPILGISPYRTPLDVWLEKTSDPAFVPQGDTPQMRLGRLLEPVLAKVYEEDHPGRTVARGDSISAEYLHPNGISYAHLDGLVMPDGGVWEGKTAWDDRDWEAGVPVYYETQVRYYLALTGAPFADVTAFFRQAAAFAHYRIEPDTVTDQGLVELAERFWRKHVETRVPPPLDGSAGTSRYLSARFPKQTRDDELAADPVVDQIGAALLDVRRAKDEVEKEEQRLKNLLMAAMTEYGVLQGSGWRATWRRSRGATTTAWREVASGYRGLLHQVQLAIDAGNLEGARRLLVDNPPDTIKELYTQTGPGTRPFVFRSDK